MQMLAAHSHRNYRNVKLTPILQSGTFQATIWRHYLIHGNLWKEDKEERYVMLNAL